MLISELLEGLNIIVKYEPDANLEPAHDKIYAGRYNADQMSKEDRQRMDALEWLEGEESWMHFT